MNVPEYDRTPQYAVDIPLQDMVEFAENPEPRCPCVIVLNICEFEGPGRLEALKEGIQTFKRELQEDALASLRVEVAVITYGWGRSQLHKDFATADEFEFNPGSDEFKFPGRIDPASGSINEMDLALDIIEERKALYRQSGISYYRPWIIQLLSCISCPIVDRGLQAAALQRISIAEREKKAAFFAIGTDDMDMRQVAETYPIPRPPLLLKGLAFRELFLWLSGSMNRVSSSRPGDEVRLDVGGLRNWADV